MAKNPPIRSVVLGRQAPRRPTLTHRAVVAAARPFAIVAVLAVLASLVAAAMFPLFAPAGAAVKVADSKFLGQVDAPLDLPTLAQRTTIYAADGSVLATLYRGENRVTYPLSSYNQNAQHAVLAVEDHGFYQHGAVDVYSTLRALLADLKAGHPVQGGSTIAQQLVKNTVTGSAETIERKIQEARDAIRLEQTYTKGQIFEAYLNTIYMGNSVYGYGTASEWYFNRPPSKLNLSQAALLAGIIQAPEAYNPAIPENVPAALERRNQVLGDMLQYGWITQEDYDRASHAGIKLSTKGRTQNQYGPEPYWVDYVKHLFLTDPAFGATMADREHLLYQGGLQIYTTLNRKIQNTARQAMAEMYYLPSDPQAASVTVNAQTGAILSMADGNETYGTDSSKGQSTVNYGWQALRPTGSAFKVFTLAAALSAGIQPTSQWKGNSPLTIPNCGGGDTWTVHNSEGNLPGFHTLTTATADSINVVFAQLINTIGPQAVVDIAHKMGIERAGSDIPGTDPAIPYVGAVCPITVGSVSVSPLDMTTGVSTLANKGIHCMPYAISKVVRSGSTIFKAQPDCKRAIPEDIAAQETSMLEQVICCGTASGRATLTPARPEAGKTGTDTDFKNAYFVGYVPQIATGVWVGYAHHATRSIAGDHGRAGFGADAAAPIWTQVMDTAVANLPVEQFPPPPAPKTGTVPSVVGMDKQTAIDTLVKAQFTPNAVDGPCVQPAGIVCSQTPAGGSTAPLGTTVTFTVSNGQTPKAPVPDVVGMARGAASATLKGAGFSVAVTFQDVHNPKQDGIVQSQQPAGGSQVTPGSTVTIVVGKLIGSPPPTPSPSPTGRPTGMAGGGDAPAGQGSGAASWYLGSALLVPAGLLAALRRRVRRGRRSA